MLCSIQVVTAATSARVTFSGIVAPLSHVQHLKMNSFEHAFSVVRFFGLVGSEVLGLEISRVSIIDQKMIQTSRMDREGLEMRIPIKLMLGLRELLRHVAQHQQLICDVILQV